MTSTGCSALHPIRFGIVPHVLPVILSQVLYYFDRTHRSATFIGIEGAGGISLYLLNDINQQLGSCSLHYPDDFSDGGCD